MINDNLEYLDNKTLHFAGEVLDINGRCGGYNLHFAFATALKILRYLIMKIKISNIKILANQNITPYEYLKNKYKINDIKDLKILRRSIDARDKENVYLVYTICFTTNNKKY